MTQVDQSALKVNQTGIVATVLVAFAGSFIGWPFLLFIPALAAVLLLGTAGPDLALFKQLYLKVLKPQGLVKPQLVQDRPNPHNFAQGLGGAFLVLASLLLPWAEAAGLTVALLVAALAFINLAFSYCVGCQIYYQLSRWGLIKT